MKKNILFINGHLNTGGVEKSLVDILCHLDLEQYDVELLLLEDYGEYYKEIPQGVKVRLLDLHNTYGNVLCSIKKCIKERDWNCLWIRIIFFVTKFLGKSQLKWIEPLVTERKKYDYSVGFRSGIASELVAYAVKSEKKYTWWHHGEFNLNELQAKEYLEMCQLMNEIICVSKGCKQLLTNQFPVLQNKFKVIPNMLDIKKICEKSKEEISIKKIPGVYDLITVGRLSPEKHIENVVHVAKSLLKLPDFRFRWFIVGEGEERAKLEQLIIEKGVSKEVQLIGSKDNPYPYFRLADFVVHTSYVESQCLVVLEAMALGKVCVVTKSMGPNEFVIDKKNAFLAETNVESLQEVVMNVVTMNNKNSFEQIKENSKKVAEGYSTDVIISKIEDLFE